MTEREGNGVVINTSQHQNGEMVVDVEDGGHREVVQGDDGGIDEVVPEKLQDEDQFSEVWYKRWFFTVFPFLRRGVSMHM